MLKPKKGLVRQLSREKAAGQHLEVTILKI